MTISHNVPIKKYLSYASSKTSTLSDLMNIHIQAIEKHLPRMYLSHVNNIELKIEI